LEISQVGLSGCDKCVFKLHFSWLTLPSDLKGYGARLYDYW